MHNTCWRKYCCICTVLLTQLAGPVCRSEGLSLQQQFVWKHPGPVRKCGGSTQGQYHCMTMCSAYACVHCLSIVSICSMYVFSVHKPYVYVIVRDWMRSLFCMRVECTHTRVCSSAYSAHRPCDWLNGPWPDLLFTQKHTYTPHTQHTQSMWHLAILCPQLSPHPWNTFHFLFETVNTHQTWSTQSTLTWTTCPHTHLSVSSWCVCMCVEKYLAGMSV